MAAGRHDRRRAGAAHLSDRAAAQFAAGALRADFRRREPVCQARRRSAPGHGAVDRLRLGRGPPCGMAAHARPPPPVVTRMRLTPLLLASLASLSLAPRDVPVILTNHLGYDAWGPKRAVIQEQTDDGIGPCRLREETSDEQRRRAHAAARRRREGLGRLDLLDRRLLGRSAARARSISSATTAATASSRSRSSSGSRCSSTARSPTSSTTSRASARPARSTRPTARCRSRIRRAAPSTPTAAGTTPPATTASTSRTCRSRPTSTRSSCRSRRGRCSRRTSCSIAARIPFAAVPAAPAGRGRVGRRLPGADQGARRIVLPLGLRAGPREAPRGSADRARRAEPSRSRPREGPSRAASAPGSQAATRHRRREYQSRASAPAADSRLPRWRARPR